MESDRIQERQEAHALLDKLSDEQLDAVRNLLEVMVEPLSRSLAQASIEDEEITPETAAPLAAPALHSIAAKASRMTTSSASSG